MAALVNYSDSDSDSDVEVGPTASPAPAGPPSTTPSTHAGTKKPFQKLVDRSNPGKILVNLPQAAAGDDAALGPASDEPPAKRARTGGMGSRFSSFRSALPAPKKTTAAPAGAAASGSRRPGPAFSFKTSAEAAFSREVPTSVDEREGGDIGWITNSPPTSGSGMKLNLPPPESEQSAAGPSIPDGQKPAGEVKLVGKTSTFVPLSVARKQQGKRNGINAKPGSNGGATAAAVSTPTRSATTAQTAQTAAGSATQATSAPAEPPKKKKKVSLFSLGGDKAEIPMVETAGGPPATDGYEPLFEDNVSDPGTGQAVYSDYASYQVPESTSYPDPHAAAATTTIPTQFSPHQSLDAMADDLNLSAAARRELFGRGGTASSMMSSSSSSSPSGTVPRAGPTVVSFNLEREYRHNEELRASGELSQPARAVKGIAPGKHNLRQLVNAVQSQRDALEESFAKNRSNQKEAAGRYGWR